MKSTNKLTPAQVKVLQDALDVKDSYYGTVKPAGRLRSNGISAVTVAILFQAGLIEYVDYIRDEVVRREYEGRRNACINNATELLVSNPSNWREALKVLAVCKEEQSVLDRRAYWITDAGRTVLEACK